MSNIGTFSPRSKDDFWEQLRGQVQTVAFCADIKLKRSGNAEPDSNYPSHRVLVCVADGSEIEVGGAWTKTMSRGENSGETFLSVSLDDPSFPNPLNFAVFRDEDVAVATWRRRQAKSA